MATPLLPPLIEPPGGRTALRFPAKAIEYEALSRAVAALSGAVSGARRAAIWADASAETCAAVAAALAAGVPAVPINPRAGSGELEHVVRDSDPDCVLAEPGAELPAPLAVRRRVDVDLGAALASGPLPPEPDPEAPALIVYTSGTTGPPKGAVLPRRAIAFSLDALAEAWAWTAEDTLVHALPLFHVHGLVLGVLGPLRLGGTVHHVGRFSPAAVAAAFRGGATMMFGVPTMYRRLADAVADGAGIADALARARLLVSGSAPLPASEHERFERLTGQQIVERYGLTETMMNTATRADGPRRPGYVGPPLPGVELRLVDEDGSEIAVPDSAERDGAEPAGAIGEIEVRGPNVFLGYLGRPDATAEAFRDGWFRTGDLATREPDGYIRIVGRRATDLIKTGGYKIGAGEIEAALREHPAVDDAAVTAEADPDLGERPVAWVASRAGADVSADELIDHVASLLAPHKRPRAVHIVGELPRNELGKVQKNRLGTPPRP